MQIDSWDQIVSNLPGAHILQTFEWGKFKSKYGWQTIPMTWEDDGKIVASALILKKSIPIAGLAERLSVIYLPKGPQLIDWNDDELRNRILSDLEAYARKNRAIFLKIDPDVKLGLGIPGTDDEIRDIQGDLLSRDLAKRGWLFSKEQVQFRNTLYLDLSISEADLMRNMKQKTRYNIRVAERHGVTIRTGGQEDFPVLYSMYAETAARDGFVIRDQSYYSLLWNTFSKINTIHFPPMVELAKISSKFPYWKMDPIVYPGVELLIAEWENVPIAGLILFHFSKKAWFFYGMSTNIHREKMPNYLIQWHAICLAKQLGCTVYDLWGAPDLFDPSDPLYGVYKFKEGLGGKIIRHVGAWDFPVSKMLYITYTQLIPRFLEVARNRRRRLLRRVTI